MQLFKNIRFGLHILATFFKQMDKLKRQLAEAEAALEARKKPPEDNGPRIVGEGLDWRMGKISDFVVFNDSA